MTKTVATSNAHEGNNKLRSDVLPKSVKDKILGGNGNPVKLSEDELAQINARLISASPTKDQVGALEIASMSFASAAKALSNDPNSYAQYQKAHKNFIVKAIDADLRPDTIQSISKQIDALGRKGKEASLGDITFKDGNNKLTFSDWLKAAEAKASPDPAQNSSIIMNCLDVENNTAPLSTPKIKHHCAANAIV
jgi:hypothetical protein